MFNTFSFLLLITSVNLFSQTNTAIKKTIDSLQTVYSKQISQKDSLNACSTSYVIAKLYDNNSEKEKCISELKSCLLLSQAIKDYMMIGRISNYLASVNSEMGNRNEAIKLYNQSYLAFEKKDAKPKMAAVLMNIGTEYVSLGNYKKAIETELNAIKLKEQSKDSSNIAYYYLSLAELFFSVKDYAKWEEYLLFAEKLSMNPNYSSFITQAKIANELGEYHRRKNNFNKAVEYYNKLYEMSVKEGYENGISSALKNLVPIYISKGDYKSAEKTTRRSLAIDRKINRITGIISNLIQLGVLNRVLGNYSASLNYLREGLALATKHNNSEEHLKALEELYLVNKNIGHSAEALKFYEQYNTKLDSVMGIETQKQIAEIERKYETEKKQVRINLLNKENELQKIELANQKIIIGAIVLFASLSALLGFLFYKQSRTKMELNRLQAEHKMLRSQMNPHFIFNSLMAIQNFLFKNDAAKTADYLSEFASLMRLILAGSRSDKITLADEITITEHYLSLQKMRFNSKFDYEIKTDEQLDVKSITIPPMLIQPFVENAVEHGVRTLEDGNGKISVSFEQKEGALQIQIGDNGRGIGNNSTEKRQEHVSYATQITKERIAAIEKMNKAKIEMEIIDLSKKEGGQGTSVKFVFPNSLITSGKV